jgi:hypothetical protein
MPVNVSVGENIKAQPYHIYDGICVIQERDYANAQICYSANVASLRGIRM